MGERGDYALFRELKIYSVECYGFERVQLIERAVLFLFHMTVIPAVGGGSYPPAIFPKEVMRMPYSLRSYLWHISLIHVHHLRRRDL